ncbi:putative ATP-dependent RNA helicase Ecm32p [[Candida] jaroonii]|uniref:ATP-dependent RNA helicase Ecm32p n=1 Tax=[Candida] jaroonii TaxID=467808 RepID=A0ACA9YB33_9ASCO|nr:putative ATP-dependent RNA helicase Ecm32p [[Candida] jaroonii]
MATVTCCTCKLTCNLDDISKHLSSTRHKQVQYDPLEEIIECEECDDTNIHQLQILRFGLNDMTLLCQACLNKEDKPSIQYSLSNGSLFKKIEQYFTFRDLECKICANDKRLSITKENGENLVVCNNCKPGYQEKFPNAKFVSEDDDYFLSELFGLTEFKPNGKFKSKKRGKRAVRGGKRKPKVVSAQKQKEADERRDYYFSKLAQSKELKSGTTVKAVGYEEPKSSRTNNSSTKGSKPTGKGAFKGPSSKSGPSNNGGRKSNFNTPSPSPRASKPNSAKQSRSTTPIPKGKPSSLPTKPERQIPSSLPSKPETNNKPSNKGKAGKPTEEQSSKNGNKVPLGKKGDNKKKEKSEKVGSVQENKPKKESAKNGNKEKNTKESKPEPKKVKNDKLDSKKDQGHSKKDQGDAKKDSKGKLKGAKVADVKQNGAKGKDTKSKDTKSKQTNKVLPSDESKTKDKTMESEQKPIVLPPGISKYTPSKEPPLSYDSMEKYFQEMSYNLFLEEKLSMSSSNNAYIDSTESVLLWYEDQDKKNKQYKLEIKLTQEFKNKFLRKSIQKFRKEPFSADQTMFLILNDEIAWYGKIVLCEIIKVGRGRVKEEVLEVIIENFDWNYQKLPTNVNVKHLKILPASIPVSRVFLAMSRIENPKFIKMLLGKEPIRHIDFKNYVKFSDPNKFNESQKVALQSVLNNPITVLQGPPGTGKTSTIHEIILQLLNNLNTYPILVVAASNIAIDNIAEKLIGTHERSLLRIVANEKESDYNRSHPLNPICLHHKMHEMLPQGMKDDLIKLRTSRSNEVSVNQYKKIRSKQVELSNLLIAQARVIFTTTVVAGGNQLKSVKKFPVVIMDESTQSSEPITLIPLSMPGVEKFVFVGDQNQLSSFTQVPNLSLSLFERVLINGTYKKAHMLDTQYRMHPMISEFPRTKFYGGLLKDGITEEQRFIPSITKPVTFWDTKGKFNEERVRIRMREDNGYTYANSGEIKYIIEVLTDLIFSKKIEKKDIGIITPYRGQRDLISHELSKNDLINPTKEEIKVEVDRDDIYNESKPLTIHTVSDIMIASIDAFQGREKNFILFSCVRSNKDNKIGFLNDARRLNVALTRAKYGLIMIGDYQCLVNDGLWKEFLDHLSTKELINNEESFVY